jgi:hypothetical protein
MSSQLVLPAFLLFFGRGKPESSLGASTIFESCYVSITHGNPPDQIVRIHDLNKLGLEVEGEGEQCV